MPFALNKSLKMIDSTIVSSTSRSFGVERFALPPIANQLIDDCSTAGRPTLTLLPSPGQALTDVVVTEETSHAPATISLQEYVFVYPLN